MRQATWLLILAAATIPAALVGACGGDDTQSPQKDGGIDSGGIDGGNQLARGKYIVDTVATCGDCHTPRNPDGSPKLDQYLAGVDCFIGVDKPADAGSGGPPGCLSARNLTNDETGLKNLTDQQIRDLFQKGVRPDGTGEKYLVGVMPYWVYRNMTDDDANAVVAYLRTVPGKDHRAKPNQAPWINVPAAVPPIDMAGVHTPVKDGNPDYESQMRGRYLASSVSACMECHTPEVGQPPQSDRSKWFAGNRAFRAADLGLTSPPFPETIYTANLTPHATGLAGYSVAEIVKIVKQGKDRDGGGVCPPMPSGAMAPYSNLTDQDATDIAKYLLSLPPIDNKRTEDCKLPAGPP